MRRKLSCCRVTHCFSRSDRAPEGRCLQGFCLSPKNCGVRLRQTVRVVHKYIDGGNLTGTVILRSDWLRRNLFFFFLMMLCLIRGTAMVTSGVLRWEARKRLRHAQQSLFCYPNIVDRRVFQIAHIALKQNRGNPSSSCSVRALCGKKRRVPTDGRRSTSAERATVEIGQHSTSA